MQTLKSQELIQAKFQTLYSNDIGSINYYM